MRICVWLLALACFPPLCALAAPASQDSLPPAPLADVEPEEPPQAQRVEQARLIQSFVSAVERYVRVSSAHNPSGWFSVYDGVLKKRWALRLIHLDKDVFLLGHDLYLSSADFRSNKGDRLILDFYVQSAPYAWKVRGLRIREVNNRARFPYKERYRPPSIQ